MLGYHVTLDFTAVRDTVASSQPSDRSTETVAPPPFNFARLRTKASTFPQLPRRHWFAGADAFLPHTVKKVEEILVCLFPGQLVALSSLSSHLCRLEPQDTTHHSPATDCHACASWRRVFIVPTSLAAPPFVCIEGTLTAYGLLLWIELATKNLSRRRTATVQISSSDLSQHWPFPSLHRLHFPLSYIVTASSRPPGDLPSCLLYSFDAFFGIFENATIGVVLSSCCPPVDYEDDAWLWNAFGARGATIPTTTLSFLLCCPQTDKRRRTACHTIVCRFGGILD